MGLLPGEPTPSSPCCAPCTLPPALQEYIRIKEQEEMLQQQEALLQQQVASLRTEVEELEGSAGAKAQQSQSVFRDAPPLRVRAQADARRRGCTTRMLG